MKKKLSFLLALVFIFTLGFSVLPVAGATRTYDIHYNDNGGTGGPADQNNLRNGTYTLLQTPVPTRATDSNYSYSFAGWGYHSDSTTPRTTVTINGNDVTVYAIWNKTPIYKVIYNENGGTGGPADVTGLTNGVHTLLQTPAPTKASDSSFSYSFGGWAATSNGTTPITTVTINNGNQTVYAIWNKTPIPQFGSLDVTKCVTGYGAPSHVPFSMTVTFTGSSLELIKLNNVAGNTSGIYNITLENNQTAHFTNIPVGTSYTVAEILSQSQIDAGWKTPSYDYDDHDLVKAIDSKNDDDSVTVKNTYCEVEVGKLTVNKFIAGTDADPNQTFTIQVALANSNNGLSNVAYTTNGVVVKNSNNSYTLTLKGDQWVKFTNVPVGTTYDVTESATANWASNIVFDDAQDKEIEHQNDSQDIDTVTVTNTYTKPETPPEDELGTLTVTKQVTGSVAAGTEFEIVVTFTGSGANDIYRVMENIIPASVEATQTLQILEENSFTIYLQDGESAEFANVPVGIKYTVVETNKKEAVSTTGEVFEDENATFSLENSSVIIINNYGTPPTEQPTPPPVVINYGALTVAKSVSGVGASATEKFAITVTFTPGAPDFWNVLGISAPAGAVGGNGVYTLSLSASDGPVTFTNIPAGTTYTVSEAIALTQSGWTEGASTGKVGTITTSGASAVLANVYAAGVAGASDSTGNAAGSEQGVAGASDVLPQTGGIASSTLLALLGLALIAIGGTAFTLLRKKNTGKSR